MKHKQKKLQQIKRKMFRAEQEERWFAKILETVNSPEFKQKRAQAVENFKAAMKAIGVDDINDIVAMGDGKIYLDNGDTIK